jgi:hypothetical protein
MSFEGEKLEKSAGGPNRLVHPTSLLVLAAQSAPTPTRHVQPTNFAALAPADIISIFIALSLYLD